MYASVPEPEAIVGQAVQMGDVTYTIVACGHKQATLQSPNGTRVKRSSPAIRKLFATGPVADEEKGAFAQEPEYEERWRPNWSTTTTTTPGPRRRRRACCG